MPVKTNPRLINGYSGEIVSLNDSETNIIDSALKVSESKELLQRQIDALEEEVATLKLKLGIEDETTQEETSEEKEVVEDEVVESLDEETKA